MRDELINATLFYTSASPVRLWPWPEDYNAELLHSRRDSCHFLELNPF